MMLMMTDVAPEIELDYHHWYNEVHLPELLALPGVRAARRFRLMGEGIRFMAAYELDDVDVVNSAAYLAWRTNSPSTALWAQRFRRQERRIYEQIFP
jgi:hypothetical protein